MKEDKLNGFEVIASVTLQSQKGLRDARIVLVDRGSEFDDPYVTALHCFGCKSWSGGHYFIDVEDASEDFARRWKDAREMRSTVTGGDTLTIEAHKIIYELFKKEQQEVLKAMLESIIQKENFNRETDECAVKVVGLTVSKYMKLKAKGKIECQRK